MGKFGHWPNVGLALFNGRLTVHLLPLQCVLLVLALRVRDGICELRFCQSSLSHPNLLWTTSCARARPRARDEARRRLRRSWLEAAAVEIAPRDGECVRPPLHILLGTLLVRYPGAWRAQSVRDDRRRQAAAAARRVAAPAGPRKRNLREPRDLYVAALARLRPLRAAGELRAGQSLVSPA